MELELTFINFLKLLKDLQCVMPEYNQTDISGRPTNTSEYVVQSERFVPLAVRPSSRLATRLTVYVTDTYINKLQHKRTVDDFCKEYTVED